MKVKIIFCLIQLVFWGCAAKMTIAVAADLQNPPPGATPHPGMVPNQQSGLVLPYGISVVPSADQEESAAISNRVIQLVLKDRDFDKLDDYASNLRTSKVSWATGLLEISNFLLFILSCRHRTGFEWKTAWRVWMPGLQPSRIPSRAWRAGQFLDPICMGRQGQRLGRHGSDEGWRLFNERLNQAEEVLDDAEN